MTDLDALRAAAAPALALIEDSADAAKLCRAIAWSERFSFHVAGCTSPQLATALQLWLRDAVPCEREQPITHLRISPYPLDWRDADPPLLVGNAIAAEVEMVLLSDAARVDLIVIDGARARPAEADAWSRVFALLNLIRNVIARDLQAAVLIVLPIPLVRELALAAGDLWSIRSSTLELRDGAARREPPRVASGEYTSDAELLRLARSGDAKAAEILYSRVVPSLRRHLGRMGARDIEDITHDTFMKILSSQFTPSDTLALAHAVAFLLHKTSARTNRYRQTLLSRYPDMDDTERSTPGLMSIDAALARVEEEMKHLPWDLREIVSLRMEGLSLPEIATTLGLSVSAVKRRNDQAIIRLRALLGEVEGPFL